MTGKVYIASMQMRGEWAEVTCDNYIKINATSAQAKLSKNRLAFSPMTPIEGCYKGFWNFEHYWHSGKVYEGIDHLVSYAYWINLKEPKRRYPKGKGLRVLHAVFPQAEPPFAKIPLDYITSRKRVYCPEYLSLIENLELIQYYRNLLKTGKNIVVYDFDGPKDSEGKPICLELTLDLLIDKINDPTFPFGHGYLVASTIANIPKELYSM